MQRYRPTAESHCLQSSIDVVCWNSIGNQSISSVSVRVVAAGWVLDGGDVSAWTLVFKIECFRSIESFIYPKSALKIRPKLSFVKFDAVALLAFDFFKTATKSVIFCKFAWRTQTMSLSGKAVIRTCTMYP